MISYKRVGDEITLYIKGEFGNAHRAEFQEIFSTQKGDPKSLTYIVDFSNTTFISSVGAGLLIRLREHCGGETAKISLVNVNERNFKLLKILRFDEIFLISVAK